MPQHEQYEEFCALAASGQITAGEWEALRIHLQSCSECADLLGDFGEISSDIVSEFASAVPQGRFTEMRSRFLERARLVGGNLSSYPFPSPPRMPIWTARAALIAGGIAAALAIILSGLYVRTQKQVRLLEAHNASLREIRTVTSNRERNTSQGEDREPRDLLVVERGIERERDLLRAKLSAAMTHQDELESRIVDLTSQLFDAKTRLTAAESDREGAGTQLAQIQRTLERTQSKEAIHEAEIASARTQIESLNQELLLARARFEREKALLAAGKEGQSIIAARNLHIIDVYDSDGRGKRRSFGRVFYVEGQELVFYAYDLADPRHANAEFYAWGAGDNPANSVTCLGILHYDGQGEQRWVLRYADTNVLPKLDSIFVTAETGENPERPKGKRILYAVLTGQPNHP